MQHCDPEVLSLLALGEEVDVDREHLDSCADCTAELSALQQVVGTARSGLARSATLEDARRVAPPPHVWDGVATATGVTSHPRRHLVEGDAPPAPPAASVPAHRGRRRWSTWAVAAAAVAGVVGGGAAASALTDRATAAPADVALRADLEPLVVPGQAGTADVEDVGGDVVLHVTASGLPADSAGSYQVWLLDAEAQRMVNLGVLSGDEAQFAVPAGLDLSDYPVVDVSAEPLDGNPAHSGDSLLRGTLQG